MKVNELLIETITNRSSIKFSDGVIYIDARLNRYGSLHRAPGSVTLEVFFAPTSNDIPYIIGDWDLTDVTKLYQDKTLKKAIAELKKEFKKLGSAANCKEFIENARELESFKEIIHLLAKR